jgi:hypothetical protein
MEIRSSVSDYSPRGVPERRADGAVQLFSVHSVIKGHSHIIGPQNIYIPRRPASIAHDAGKVLTFVQILCLLRRCLW